MSIKDKISFWEKLNTPQQPKVTPIINNALSKKTIPSQTSPLPVNQTSKINTNLFPQKQLNKEPIKQITIKNINSNAQKQPVKPQKQSCNNLQQLQTTNVQKQLHQNQDKIISVKDNIKKFNNLPIPNLSQNIQSCVVLKKKQTPKKQQENVKKSQNEVILMNSSTRNESVNSEERQMSFKQKQMMLQRSLANKSNYPMHIKKQDDESSELKEIQTNIKSHVTQEDQNRNNQHQDKNKPHGLLQNQKQRIENQLSNKLFEESMKEHQLNSNELVTGQRNTLTLQTRMTKRVKRKNNDDDFDNL